MTPAQVTRLRKILRLDVPGLAEVMGVDERTIYRWESGERECKGPAALLLVQMAEGARLARKDRP